MLAEATNHFQTTLNNMPTIYLDANLLIQYLVNTFAFIVSYQNLWMILNIVILLWVGQNDRGSQNDFFTLASCISCFLCLPANHLPSEMSAMSFSLGLTRLKKYNFNLGNNKAFKFIFTQVPQWCSDISPCNSSYHYNTGLRRDTCAKASLFLGKKALLHFMNQKLGGRKSISALSGAVTDLTWRQLSALQIPYLWRKLSEEPGHIGRVHSSPYSYPPGNNIRNYFVSYSGLLSYEKCNICLSFLL